MSSTNPTEFNKRLGAAVRSCRIMRGLSQEAVGNELDVTFQQIQKYERGINRISVETLIKIARFLETTPQELIDATRIEGEAEQEPGAADKSESLGDRMTLETVARLKGLQPPRQRIALNVIKALAGEEAA